MKELKIMVEMRRRKLVQKNFKNNLENRIYNE